MTIKSRIVLGAATLLIGTLILSIGCGGGSSATTCEAPLQLRSYEIDPDLGRELAGIINEALARGEDQAPVGRATVGPAGRLIVAAPEGVLATVEGLVADVAGAAPSPPPVVSVSYWMVSGRPATTTQWSERLESVAPALGGIASAEGPTAFELDEKIMLHSLSGEGAMTGGRGYRVSQRTSERGGAVFAELHIEGMAPRRSSLQMSVRLEPAQLLVLGQSGVRYVGGEEDPEETLYYIVQAEVESSGRS